MKPNVDALVRRVRLLRKDECVRSLADKRMAEFEAVSKKPSKEIFKELCFCLLTANFNAERSISIQEKVGNGFLSWPKDKLALELARLGHRYPNARAAYIFEARRYKDGLKEILERLADDFEAREWVTCNIKGLGYKEASHFLRNIGRKSLAIIDFHIVDLLANNGLLEPPKTRCLTRKKYLEIEKVLGKIGEKSGLSQGELDLYLWYMETGKILK
jgi:N-glycosylase/DNA lyase